MTNANTKAPMQPIENFPTPFADWFSTSRVVDEDGRPQVAYHGTIDNDILEFKSSLNGIYGDGIYFSTDPEVASFWAGDRESEGFDYEPGGSVYPVYLRLLNPASEEVASELESHYGPNTSTQLRKLGYDGIITRDGEIVVFDVEQIKFAILSNPTASLESVPDHASATTALNSADRALSYIEKEEDRQAANRAHIHHTSRKS